MDASGHDQPRVVVALGDPGRRQRLSDALAGEGFACEHVDAVPALLGTCTALPPDVVLLDSALQGGGGAAALGALREDDDAYVILFVDEPDDVQVVLGLTMGADDVVRSGASPREVAARCRAMLRRPRRAPGRSRPIDAGGLRVDPAARVVMVRDGTVDLTRIEFEILWTLVQEPRAVVERWRLIERVWGPRWSGDEHALDVHMGNLRNKLKAAGEPLRIVTVRGVGFRADPLD